MITMLLAKTGALDPRIGAWAPFVVFMTAGVLLFRSART
jgi:lipopolysaccharide export LptBFGC system permease protein LptF